MRVWLPWAHPLRMGILRMWPRLRESLGSLQSGETMFSLHRSPVVSLATHGEHFRKGLLLQSLRVGGSREFDAIQVQSARQRMSTWSAGWDCAKKKMPQTFESGSLLKFDLEIVQLSSCQLQRQPQQKPVVTIWTPMKLIFYQKTYRNNMPVSPGHALEHKGPWVSGLTSTALIKCHHIIIV